MRGFYAKVRPRSVLRNGSRCRRSRSHHRAPRSRGCGAAAIAGSDAVAADVVVAVRMR